MSNHLSFSIFTIVSIIAKLLKMMKAKFVYMLLLLGLMCSTCCSEDFFLDDYEGECWNGQGLPSWINEKNENYKQELDPHYDCVNPHSDYLLCNLYRFKYQNEWYIAMAYERCYPSFLEPEKNKFSYISDTFFYNAYCKKVNPDKVEKDFNLGKELIWSNEIGPNGYIPQIKDFTSSQYLTYEQREQDWLQKKIMEVCESLSVQNSYIIDISISNCSVSDENIYVEFYYRCYERNNSTLVTVRRFFSLEGKEVLLEGDLRHSPALNLHVFLREIGMDYTSFL